MLTRHLKWFTNQSVFRTQSDVPTQINSGEIKQIYIDSINFKLGLIISILLLVMIIGCRIRKIRIYSINKQNMVLPKRIRDDQDWKSVDCVVFF